MITKTSVAIAVTWTPCILATAAATTKQAPCTPDVAATWASWGMNASKLVFRASALLTLP